MELIEIKIFAAKFIEVFGKLLFYAIFARVILSWMRVAGSRSTGGAFARFINDVTNPVLKLAQKVPHQIGMLDLSPFIALIGVQFFTWVLLELVKMI
jgi:uncharacterized protein YggT (Ycf19 family)